MVYLVTWDFNKEDPLRYQQKRAALMERFKNTECIKDPGLDSVVFVDSALSAEETYEFFNKGIFDVNDRLVVTRMTDWHALLVTDVSNWITARM